MGVLLSVMHAPLRYGSRKSNLFADGHGAVG